MPLKVNRRQEGGLDETAQQNLSLELKTLMARLDYFVLQLDMLQRCTDALLLKQKVLSC